VVGGKLFLLGTQYNENQIMKLLFQKFRIDPQWARHSGEPYDEAQKAGVGFSETQAGARR
jgi:hypothetical protein